MTVHRGSASAIERRGNRMELKPIETHGISTKDPSVPTLSTPTGYERLDT